MKTEWARRLEQRAWVSCRRSRVIKEKLDGTSQPGEEFEPGQLRWASQSELRKKRGEFVQQVSVACWVDFPIAMERSLWPHEKWKHAQKNGSHLYSLLPKISMVTFTLEQWQRINHKVKWHLLPKCNCHYWAEWISLAVMGLDDPHLTVLATHRAAGSSLND